MWKNLAVNPVHLAYLALGTFLCLFFLFSSFLRHRLMLGEANVALLVGAAMGPFAAGLLDPSHWRAFSIVVLEFSRVLLTVQCFAVALELPKRYLTKHWKSLIWVIGPMVVWSWMLCSLSVWFMVPTLEWEHCLAIAACFNAIDPVLASSVFGSSKLSKRIPDALRNLILAESAISDITTSTALGLSILLARHGGSPKAQTESLFVYTVTYQIILAAVIGLIIGSTAQLAMRLAHERDFIDRQSFLAFFIMIALFCTGLSSIMGIDDVLMGFFAGYAFAKDGWVREKTEEAHVSAVFNLLLTCSFYIFLGAIIPWKSFHRPDLDIVAWRLAIGTILMFLLRRLPIVLLLKPFIDDIATWRDALFFGHFGPVGAGAIFSAALIISEPGETGVANGLLATSPDDPLVTALWPIVTFTVLCSSIIHGSSAPLFVLGRKINTLTITLSYTSESSAGPAWIDRLRRSISNQGDVPIDFSYHQRSSSASSVPTTEVIELPIIVEPAEHSEPRGNGLEAFQQMLDSIGAASTSTSPASTSTVSTLRRPTFDDDETAAERRRRLDALGILRDDSAPSDSDSDFEDDAGSRQSESVSEARRPSASRVRFAPIL